MIGGSGNALKEMQKPQNVEPQNVKVPSFDVSSLATLPPPAPHQGNALPLIIYLRYATTNDRGKWQRSIINCKTVKCRIAKMKSFFKNLVIPVNPVKIKHIKKINM